MTALELNRDGTLGTRTEKNTAATLLTPSETTDPSLLLQPDRQVNDTACLRGLLGSVPHDVRSVLTNGIGWAGTLLKLVYPENFTGSSFPVQLEIEPGQAASYFYARLLARTEFLEVELNPRGRLRLNTRDTEGLQKLKPLTYENLLIFAIQIDFPETSIPPKTDNSQVLEIFRNQLAFWIIGQKAHICQLDANSSPDLVRFLTSDLPATPADILNYYHGLFTYLELDLHIIEQVAHVLEQKLQTDAELGQPVEPFHQQVVNKTITAIQLIRKRMETAFILFEDDNDLAQKLKIKSSNIHQIVEKAVTEFHDYEADGKTFTIRGPKTGSFYFDEDRINKVLHNLIKNACNHGKNIRVIFGISGNNLVVFVANDEGAIDLDKFPLEYLVTIGKRAEEAMPGSGAGLAIADKIIRVHGGRLGVNSKPETGTVFYFLLPQSQSSISTISLFERLRYSYPDTRHYADVILERYKGKKSKPNKT